MKTTNYRNNIAQSWCKGCSFYPVLQAITGVLEELQIEPDKINVISGIGCSSRMSLYFNTFGMHTLHGRAIPVAIGARLSRPEIPVLVIGGDGDLFSIGIGHFIHAARKNINMTVLCLDNQMFAMTKNQVSPTAPCGQKGTFSPQGKPYSALNVLECAISSGATFVARTNAFSLEHMQSIISQAFDHKGFSFVEIVAPCRTFDKDSFKSEIKTVDVSESNDYNPTDYITAVKSAVDLYCQERVLTTGVFWKVNQPVYEDISIQKNTPKLNAKQILGTLSNHRVSGNQA